MSDTHTPIYQKGEGMTDQLSSNSHDVWLTMWGNSLKLLGLSVVVAIVAAITCAKFDKLRTAPALEPGVSTAERMTQLGCLSQNIYYEAAGESFEGKVAVAQVTMNRVEDGRFGTGVCGVIFQRNKVYEKVICQFSWACDSKSKAKPINSVAYAESEEVAKKVLLEGFRLSSLNEALWYHADYIPNPVWTNNMKRVTKIGRHIYYEKT